MEVRIAIDTTRSSDLCSGVHEVVEQFARAERIFVQFVTLAELRAGFHCGRSGRKNEGVLVRFLGRPRVGVLYPDEDTTHHYARLFAQLRSMGTPIPTNDIRIAAFVLQHDLVSYSRDRHFDRLPQLPIVG